MVAGTSSPAPGKFVVPPPLFVYVCRDAGAGGYEAFPDVCRLRDGQLMVVFYAGYGHVSMPNEHEGGGLLLLCDEHTWSPLKFSKRAWT